MAAQEEEQDQEQDPRSFVHKIIFALNFLSCLSIHGVWDIAVQISRSISSLLSGFRHGGGGAR